MRSRITLIALCVVSVTGCGTTKFTDTSRTAIEQLLISDAMDQAISRLDFRAVAGKNVYLDSSPLSAVTDSAYLISTMRQHMLAAGCILKEDREDADYVVEVRAGAVGTDRRDVVFGMPATEISGLVPLAGLPGIPAAVPEMPLAKKTEQRAVAKIAVFAYNRHTGRPIWQSGSVPIESTAKHVWVLGAGPFERGSIFDGTEFVGNRIKIPLLRPGQKVKPEQGLVSVAREFGFSEPEPEAATEQQLAEGGEPEPRPDPAPDGKVLPAAHAAPVEPQAAPGAPAAVPPPNAPAAEPPARPPTSPGPDIATQPPPDTPPLAIPDLSSGNSPLLMPPLPTLPRPLPGAEAAD
jgi:hypothetical protein